MKLKFFTQYTHNHNPALTMFLHYMRLNLFSGITSDSLSPVLKERGSLYLRNKDKDGWPLLVFAVRKHIKGMESPEIMKQHFLYYMDRIDR